MRLVLLLVLLVLGTTWFLSLRRAGTLFVLKLAEGRATLVRGRLPPRLFADMEDVAARAASARGVVECHVSDGAPRLTFRGVIDPGVQQQLRNVLAGVTAAQIRGGRYR